ncbi:unnamed protein product [Lactuca virosa]|uniref:F-box domain-containing protein n=1 Tax=Lactuca virosa TaxID=75947 RepID=A0AAU9N909_9ASTR|nr:unnamed protein product [Lactuca virosa]
MLDRKSEQIEGVSFPVAPILAVKPCRRSCGFKRCTDGSRNNRGVFGYLIDEKDQKDRFLQRFPQTDNLDLNPPLDFLGRKWTYERERETKFPKRGIRYSLLPRYLTLTLDLLILFQIGVYLIGRHSGMDMTRRVTRNQNDDDASSSETIKTDDVGPWSYLNHDLLLLVMMQLGVINFVAFSGVCKSWRSVALSNRKSFMASKPPMLMNISDSINKDWQCCLEDHERRKFKTTLTHSAGMYCCGFTCGYLILFRIKTKDFWLVNLITRHELFFPPAPWVSDYVSGVASVLVFSPSISKLVFVILAQKQIWFSIADEGAWNCVSSTFDFNFYKDLHVFKGKIYTLNSNNGHLCELVLNPELRVTLLETNNLLDDLNIFSPQLVSCGENLYMILMEGLFRDEINVIN